jgi:predicted PurR-regulated permease PerM
MDKKTEVNAFLIAVILFIVALVLLVMFMYFYFKGGVNLFNSIPQTNGTPVVNSIHSTNYGG